MMSLRRPRGMALAVVTGLVLVTMLLMTSLLMQTEVRYAQSVRGQERIQALHLAQAGVAWARSQATALSPTTLALSGGEVTVRLEERDGVPWVIAEGRVLMRDELRLSRTLEVPR